MALRYACHRGQLDLGEARCISFGGGLVDAAVSVEILRVVQPGVIEAARRAQGDRTRAHDEVEQAIRLALQEARFGAERARRQYAAVDPENRLVAEELERRWNEALQKVQQLEERLVREESQRTSAGEPSPVALLDLAGRLSRIWTDETTDVRLKKRIARTLIEEIVVDLDRDQGRIPLVIHWKGGVHTEVSARCRRRGENRCQATVEVAAAIHKLARISPDLHIAGLLNRNGLRTGHGLRWTEKRVAEFRSRRGVESYSAEQQERDGWMTLTQAAAALEVHTKALRHAVEQGLVQAEHPLGQGPWIFHRGHLDEPALNSFLGRIRRRGRTARQVHAQRSLFQATT